MKIHFFEAGPGIDPSLFAVCVRSVSLKKLTTGICNQYKRTFLEFHFFLLVKIPEKQIGTVLGGHAPLANDGHVRLNPKIHFLKKITITYRVKL